MTSATLSTSSSGTLTTGTPQSSTVGKRKMDSLAIPQTEKRNKQEPRTAFEKYLSNLSFSIQAFPNNENIESAKQLVKANLTVLGSLKPMEKLSFSEKGEIKTRPSKWTGAPWQNLLSWEENQISNLKEFSNFVTAFFHAVMRKRQNTPNQDPVTFPLITELKDAAKGLEHLRQAYVIEYGTNDTKNHEEITENCIRAFISLASQEQQIDDFIKNIYSTYTALKEEHSDQEDADLNKIIRFSHSIEPFIESLKKTIDNDLKNIADFLKLNTGYLQRKYFPLLFGCYFISMFAEKDVVNPQTFPISDFKKKLNLFCAELVQERKNMTDDQGAEDLNMLEKKGQYIFLKIIDDRAIKELERGASKFSHYGELFTILAAIGIVGTAATFPSVIPGLILTISTKGAVNALQSLYQSNKEKLDALDNIQLKQLEYYFSKIGQLYEENNRDLDKIIDHLQKEYDEASKAGERFQNLLVFFKNAKTEKEGEQTVPQS